MFSNFRLPARSIKPSVLLAAFFCLAGTAQGEVAGSIVEAIGDARLVGQPTRAGNAVKVGDSLSTGSDGYLYLKTIDGGFLILRPGSHARLVAYHVDAAQPANTRIKIELQHGVARSISGDAVKNARENFRFNTPVAAIGVRGTDFTVFANDDTTRVIVVSGGVVVSGFGAGCTPEGAGPCAGDARHELFAGQAGQVLQVNRGQVEPQLLRSHSLSPDAGSPPRNDEPRSDAKQNGASSHTKGLSGSTELSLQPLKEEGLGQQRAGSLAPTPPDPAPTRPAIVWGRWQPLADKPADLDLAKLQSDYQRIGMDSYFALLRARGDTWQAPASGIASFALQGGQALIQIDGAAATSPANLENGKLTIDFGSSRFATQFDIVAQGQRIPRQAEGGVFKDGTFGNANQFLGKNNMLVQGVLANDPGLRAAYLFQSRIDDNRVVKGVTAWAK